MRLGRAQLLIGSPHLKDNFHPPCMLRVLRPLITLRHLTSIPRLTTTTTHLRTMSSSYEIVATEAAPKAIGPYVQATKFGDFLFTSSVAAPSRSVFSVRNSADGSPGVAGERSLLSLRR